VTLPQRGEIVLVPFPYSDLRGMKRRPACVVSASDYHAGPDVVVAMVTSQTRRLEHPGLGDVIVGRWRTAGLWAPSTIRTGRLLVLERRLLETTLGTIDSSTAAEVDDALRSVFALG
jgi:mRNA interferase MazF